MTASAARGVAIRIGIEGGDDIRRQFEQIGTEGQTQLQRAGTVDLSGVRQQFEQIGTAASQSAAAAAVSIGTLNVQITETGRATSAAMDEAGRASDTLSGRLASMGGKAQGAADAFNSVAAAGQSLNEVLRLSYTVRTAEDALVSVGHAAAGTASEIDKVVERAVVLRVALSSLRGIGLAIPGVQELMLAGIAIGKVAGIVGDAIEANDSYIASYKRLQDTLVRTNSASGLTATAMEEAAARQAQAGRGIAAAMTAVAEQVVKVRSVTAENLPKVLALSEDLAVKLGKDLPASAKTLTDWMEQGTRAFADMEAAGIRVGYAAEKQAKGFEDAGNKAAVTQTILDAVQRSVGGTAAQMDEGAASVHRFELAWESLITGVGQKLGPFVQMVRDAWKWLTAPLDFPRDLGSMFMENLTDALGTRPLAQQLDRDKKLLADAIAERDRLIEAGGESAFLSVQNVENRIAVLEQRVEKGRAGLKAMGIDPEQVAADGRKLSVTLDDNARKLDAWAKTLDDGLKAAIKPELSDQIKSINAEFEKAKGDLEKLRNPDGSNKAQVDSRIADARRLADAQIENAKEAAGAYDEVGAALSDYLVKLDGERDAVLMSDRERAVMNALIQAEAAARQDDIDLTRDQRAEIAAEAGAIYDLTKSKGLFNQLVGQGKTAQEKYADTVRDATQALTLMQAAGKVSAEDLAAFTRALQEQNPAFKESQRAWGEYFQEVGGEARKIGNDVATHIFDKLMPQDRGNTVVSWFRALFRRIAVEAVNANIFIPIAARVVGAVPGLFGIQTPDGQAPPGQTGTGGGVTGTLTNWGVSKAGSYAIDRMFPGSGGFTGALDTWGYNSLGIGGMAGVMPNASVQASQLAMLQAANPTIPAAELAAGYAPAGSGAITGGLSAYLGAAGAGAFGGMLGGFIGTATNSKAAGGLSGAALGAGSAYLASAMGIGAMGGPIGLAIGAIVGGVMGLLGTQKKSSNYGGAWVETDASGSLVNRASGADSTVGDKLPAIEAAVKQSSDVLNAIVKGGGLSLGGNVLLASATENGAWTTKLGGWGGPVVSASEDAGKTALDALRYMLDHGGASGVPGLTGNADVITAIRNTKASDAQGIASDLDFAKTFRDQLALMNGSLDPVSNQVKQWTDAAKQIGETVKTNIQDWRDKAKELGLATDADLLPALKLGLDAMMGLGPVVEPLRGMAAVTKQAEIQFEQYRSGLQSLGYTTDEISAKQVAFVQKALNDYGKLINETIRLGSIAVEQAIDPTSKLTAADTLRAVGLDLPALPGLATLTRGLDGFLTLADRGTASADNLRGMQAQLNEALRDGYLSADQYSQMIGSLTARFTQGAEAAKAAASFANDLQARLYAAVGNDRSAALLRLDAQQAEELASARAAGYDTTNLLKVQATERGRSAFDLAVKDYTDAIDQQIRAINDNTATARDLASANSQFVASIRQALSDRLINKDLSPLNPLEQLQEATRQLDSAFAAAMNGDTEARSRVLALANTRDGLSKAYYGPTSAYASDFYDTQHKLEQLGMTADDQLDEAQQQVKFADQQIKELQKARDAATRMGERQLASLDSLKSVMDQSYVVWQQSLPALQAITGQNWYGNNNQVNGILNNLLSSATASTIGNYRSYFMDSPEHKTQFFKRENELGVYYGRDSYADPFGDALYSRWDGAFSDAALGYLKKLGYTGGWDANANIFIQANGHGDAFTDWIRQYGRAQGWPGFATGTDSAPPGMAWVGENGRELVQFSGGERVYTHGDSMALARSWSTANDRWGGGNVLEYRRTAGPSTGTGEVVAAVNRLCNKVEALIRVTAASGDVSAGGLAEVADGVQAVARTLASGGVRS